MRSTVVMSVSVISTAFMAVNLTYMKVVATSTVAASKTYTTERSVVTESTCTISAISMAKGTRYVAVEVVTTSMVVSSQTAQPWGPHSQCLFPSMT